MSHSAIFATSVPQDRRHDLDALRAIAMLLGILLHALMAFVPASWIVQDSKAGTWATLIVAAIHGFRMPLFFLISGFFTAMLWRKRGLRALIGQRFQRIFLPLLLGVFTIVPTVWAVGAFVSSTPQTPPTSDAATINTAKYDESLAIPLLEATVRNDPQEVTQLIARGANVNATDDRGSTAMHVACLFGYSELANVLLDAGADPTAVNADKSRPTDTLLAPWGLTKFWADLLQAKVDRAEVAAGREAIAQRLKITIHPQNSVANPSGMEVTGVAWMLLYFPLFHHLWFLWFLCWLVAGFSLCAGLASRFKLPKLSKSLVVSKWRYAWLIPLTAIPQYFMSGFGPDTSTGLLPIPVVLLYYAIFFGFGALYFDAQDSEGRVGKYWWVAILLSLLVLFPAAISLQGTTSPSWRLAAALCAAAYVWLVSFGMMGLFRQHISGESKALRYISDSSYWLYLVHIPLIIYLQYLIKDWPLSAWLKVPLLCFVTSGILLLSYDWLVRYSPLGTLLNGPRKRPTTKLDIQPQSLSIES